MLHLMKLLRFIKDAVLTGIMVGVLMLIMNYLFGWYASDTIWSDVTLCVCIGLGVAIGQTFWQKQK